MHKWDQQRREHERVKGCQSDSLVHGGKRTVKVSLLNKHITHKPVGKSHHLRREMLFGKNLSGEVACFSDIGGWIITDEDHHTTKMVPAESHPEKRRARKLCQSFSKNLPRPLNSFFGVLHVLFVPSKIIVILFERRRSLSPRLTIMRLLQCARLSSHRTYDHPCDLVLEFPWIRAGPVKAFRPNVLAIFCVNELRYDSKLVAVLAHAAFDHVANAQVFADLPHIDGLALISEGRTAGDDHHVWEARERRKEVFGHPVTQIAKVLVGAQIIKRQNCYRWNSGGDLLCWRRLSTSNSRSALVPKLDLRCV